MFDRHQSARCPYCGRNTEFDAIAEDGLCDKCQESEDVKAELIRLEAERIQFNRMCRDYDRRMDEQRTNRIFPALYANEIFEMIQY